MNEILTLRNLLPEVHTFQERLQGILHQEGFSQELIHDLLLVAEELLVNTISYGYPQGEQGQHTLTVALRIDEARKIQLDFRDLAIAFNPLLVEERDPDDERLGGWGIPMVKTLTDHVAYQRVDGENSLVVERSERDS